MNPIDNSRDSSVGRVEANINSYLHRTNQGGFVKKVSFIAPTTLVPPTPASSYANLKDLFSVPIHASTETRTVSIVPNAHMVSTSIPSGLQEPMIPEKLNDLSLAPTSEIFERSADEPALIPLEDLDASSYEWSQLQEEERSWNMNRTPTADYTSKWSNIHNELRNSVGQRQLSKSRSSDVQGKWSSVHRELLNKSGEGKLFRSKSSDAGKTQWSGIHRELKNKAGQRQLDRSKLADHKRSWSLVNEDIKSMSGSSWTLSRNQQKYNKLSSSIEDAQRKLQSSFDSKFNVNEINFDNLNLQSKGVDPVLFGKWHRVGLELKSNYGTQGISAWFSSLKNKIVESAKEVLPATSELKSTVPFQSKWAGGDLVDFTFNKSSYDLSRWEDLARDEQMGRKVDPVLYGKWHRIGLEIKSNFGGEQGWAAWFSGLKNRLSNAVAPSTKSAIKTQYFNAEPIDFTFMSRRVSYDVLRMEDLARHERIERGVDPVMFGKWHRIGMELKSTLLPYTVYNVADRTIELASDLKNSAIETASDLHLKDGLVDLKDNLVDASSEIAEKVIDTVSDLHLGDKLVNLKDSLVGASVDLVDSAKEALATPVEAPKHDFMEHGDLPLNYFAYTAESIDFIWPRLVPGEVLEAEETARRERIERGVDPVISGNWAKLGEELRTTRWSTISLPSAQPIVEKVVEIAEIAKENVKEAEGMVSSTISSSFSGLFGGLSNIAHGLMEGTSHMIEATHIKDKLGYVDVSSMAAEEKERQRRMSIKIDPMISSRKRQVEAELLNSIKSV